MHLRCYSDEAAFADTLDWKTNDHDLFTLVHSLCDRLDFEWRERFGLRFDQIASRTEILDIARETAARYEAHGFSAEILGLYAFLHVDLEIMLADRIRAVLHKRRAVGETLHEIDVA
jgi:hypothetical protein